MKIKAGNIKWGDAIKPSKMGIKNLGINPKMRAIFLGFTPSGVHINLIRWGKRSCKIYHQDFWDKEA